MKCLIEKDGSVRMAPSPALVPQTGECVFSVRACGICGSDIPRVFAGKSYYYPIVLGHEFAGVVEVSTNAALVGKRACVFPILPCGTCQFCQKEQWASCTHYDYYGSRRDGGMQQSLLVREENLVFLPENVSFAAGAMVEPTAVCLHAVKKAEISEESNVLVLGAGTIGLLSAMWARALGAARVFVSDPDPWRMRMAEKLGFTPHGGERVNAVIEASGAPAAITAAITHCEAQGRIVLVGHGQQDITVGHEAFVQILRRQLTLAGSWNTDRNSVVDDWRESVAAIAEGKIDPTALITHNIPLSDAARAFAIIGDRQEPYNKIILEAGE